VQKVDIYKDLGAIVLFDSHTFKDH